MKRIHVFVGMLLAICTTAATWDVSFACACCADRGQRTIGDVKLDAYRLDEIRRLRFDTTANLYVTDAGFEVIKGIAGPSDSYQLQVNTNPKAFIFSLRDETGRAGSLTLSMPKVISIFEVDIYEEAPPGELLLYKEWKFWSRPTATGIFVGGAGSDHNLTLILHGRGNSCPNAEDFNHWTLVMRGPRAAYSLYGKVSASPSR